MKYEERINEFIKLVNADYTINEIAKVLNVTRRSVENYSNKTGLKPKSGKKAPKFNTTYFKKIDNEEKAYILGYITADGYIGSNERTLCFNINKQDIDFIKKFDKAINANSNICKSSTPNCIKVNYCSKEIVNDLSKYGIVRNKTKTVNIPNLDEHLIRHFLRGYIDGDGCVSKRTVTITIGSEKMYSSLMKILSEHSKGKIYSVKGKNNNYYTIQLCRRNSDVIKWIYEDCKIYLDRKYNSYVQNWKYYTEKTRSNRIKNLWSKTVNETFNAKSLAFTAMALDNANKTYKLKGFGETPSSITATLFDPTSSV